VRPNRCRWRLGYYWQPIGSCQHPIRRYYCRHPTTYRLATIQHDWHTCVVTLQGHPRSMIFMSLESQYAIVINSSLGPISHRLATIHPWQTDRGRRTAIVPKTNLPIRWQCCTLLQAPKVQAGSGHFGAKHFSESWGMRLLSHWSAGKISPSSATQCTLRRRSPAPHAGSHYTKHVDLD